MGEKPDNATNISRYVKIVVASDGWDRKSRGEQLARSVNELGMSKRVRNCCDWENIMQVRDLVTRPVSDMLRIPNFGPKSLRECKLSLALMGLEFE